MKSLRETRDSRKAFKTIELTENIKKDLFDKYSAAQQRILFLDYDGTLSKFCG